MNPWTFKWLTEVSSNTAWAAITKAADLSGYTGKKVVNTSRKFTKKNPAAYMRQAERIKRMANARGMY